MPSTKNIRNIPLYDLKGRLVRFVDSSAAQQKRARGSYEFRCVVCGNSDGPCRPQAGARLAPRPNHKMALFELGDFKIPTKGETACTLTFGDSQHNVGITEGDPGNPYPVMSIVARAQDRIANWGKASYTNRAITVLHPSAL